MSEIQIGASRHKFCDVSESWIHEQVQQREKDGQPICARVMLKNHALDMLLSTPHCPHGHGGCRKPNQREEAIFKIWESEHLNQPNWTASGLYNFVKRARHFVC